MMNSEYGGIGAGSGDKDISWCFKYLTNELRLHQKICGYIYTELQDIEWEHNGFMNYDRTVKEFGYDYTMINALDFIVLDHHQSDIKLPNACAIVNPNRYDEESELSYLSAVGVCFVFLVALNKKLRDENWFKDNNVKEPDILNFLDLVSLGTVCDVVPLIGLNRAIAVSYTHLTLPTILLV